jgi:hypothetical protein
MTPETARFAQLCARLALLAIAAGCAAVGRPPASAPPAALDPPPLAARPAAAPPAVAAVPPASAAHPAARLGMHYLEMAPCFFLSPYFFHHLAIDALRTGRYASEAREYLLWAMSRLNEPDRFDVHGSLYDYVVCADGAEISTLQYDSVDGYAAQLLMLWAEYLRQTNDRATVALYAAKIRQVALLLVDLQDVDGSIFATTWSPAKYLMDNAEAYGGLRAFLEIGRRLRWRELGDYADAAENLRAAILEHFYEPQTGLFHWAIAKDKKSPSRWENYYPDALAQIFPVVYGVVEPRSDVARSVTEQFLARYADAGKDVAQRLVVQRLRALMRPDEPVAQLAPPAAPAAPPALGEPPPSAAHPAARLGRHYIDMDACFFLLAYNFDYMAIDALRTNRYVDEAKAFLLWSMSRLNDSDRFGLSGTIYDYIVCCDGREISTLQYEAADSTVAQLLLLWAEYLRRTGDRATVAQYAGKIRQAARLLLDLQDGDGLIVAMNWHETKYLMDDAEDYGGLQAFLEIGARMGWRDLDDFRKAAATLRRAIMQHLFDSDRGLFYAELDGTQKAPSHWETYYPDALAQIFPVIFQVVDSRSELARRLTDEFLRRYPNGSAEEIGHQLLVRRLRELMRPGETAAEPAAVAPGWRKR